MFGQRDDVTLLLKEVDSFESKCNQQSITSEDVSFPLCYIVKTKYFNAPVVFSQYDLTHDGDSLESVEGVIIYIAAKDSQLLQKINFPNNSQQCKLLVVNSSAVSEDASDNSRMDVINWALDNGFEYIDLPSGLSESTKDWSVREKEGFPRLMEAIHSTIWSSASKAPAGGGVRVGQTGGAEQQTDAAIASSSSSALDDNTASATEAPAKKSKSKKTAHKKTSAVKEEEDMQKLDSLETIFQKVKEQRSALQQSTDSESSGSALTQADIDRRAKAASMAMELCSLMNLCGESDSDYESDSDD